MRRRGVLLIALSLTILMLAPTAFAGEGNFHASLKGRNEAPTPVDSKAAGNAVFKVRGGDLEFKLIVANIDNVFAAHIHCGAVGVAGPVGATLYSGPLTSSSGILARGVIDAPDTGNGCGWVDVGDILDAIAAGNAYVNVHTTAFGGGEIRGQIR